MIRYAIIAFGLVGLLSAMADSGQVINHLSADAVLEEGGSNWHARVRFTTSMPAICHAEAGPSADRLTSTQPERERLRNHRFDVPGHGDAPCFVRVVASTDNGKVASETMKVSPPEPFPTGRVQRLEVPLTVRETAGVGRTEPVTFGIPLPKGALGDPSHVRLMDDGVSIPVQTRVPVRWPDRTVKWLLLSATVSIDVGETKTLTLAFGSKVSAVEPNAQNALRQTDGRFEVTAGGTATMLRIDRHGEGVIAGPDDREWPLPVSMLTADDGTVYKGHIESVEIEEHGPQRTVILARGHHKNKAGEPYFGFELRYFVRAGDPCVRIDHVLQHDIVSPDMEYGDEMRSFRSVDLVFETGGRAATVAVEEGGTARIEAGQRLFQHFDSAYELPEAEGERAPGLAMMSGLAVAVRDFWQNWPKSLAVRESGLAVGLYPHITPSDRYADRPDEHILYYYIRDGNYTFRSGFQKRHALLVGPADGATSEQMLARVREPLLVTAPSQWYIDSGALHGIAATGGRQFKAYDDALSECVDGHLNMREREHWYGLMNFGDWYGERGNNWGNIEYDMQHAMLTQYFRTGDRRFFDLAEDAARHNADVDVVHHAAGQDAGPGSERRVGQAWVHCMGHTGGYHPYDYMDMSIYAQGYAENEGHMWNQGNLEYWLLTGDEQVHRSAMQLADWVAGPNTVEFGYGNARVPGWMGIIAMSTYFATYDPYYLNAMHLIYEEVQQWADPDAGLWVRKLRGGHCRCEEKHYGEAGFMAGVLMTSLKYYYLATGDDEVARRIVKIANWLVENLYEREADNFRYTACPHTNISSSSPMIMGNGLGFAANYSGDEKLMKLVRRTFTRGFLAFTGGAHGKTIAYATCAAPMAIHELSKFPKPTLADVHQRMVQAVHDPARRRLPAIVPNPDFEQDLNGWRVRPGLKVTRTTDIAHTGNASAMAMGTIEDQNEYFVTNYSCGPPWEIMSLVPGEVYQLQLWLRVDEITDGAPAPTARVSTRSAGITRASFETGEYDLHRTDEWQLLRRQFTVPEETDAAYIAVNTRTHEPQTVRMYLDDVAIVPADAPRKDTCVWAVGEATDADVTGGVKHADEGIIDGWTVLATPDDAPGTATFTLDLPIEDDYELLIRAQLQDGDAGQLSASIDGRKQGTSAVTGERYKWISVGDRTHCDAGSHRVTVSFPAGADVMIHSVLLTNRCTRSIP